MERRKIKTFRLSQGELETLTLISLREGLNRSETLRAIIREAAYNRGVFPPGLIDLEKVRTQ